MNKDRPARVSLISLCRSATKSDLVADLCSIAAMPQRTFQLGPSASNVFALNLIAKCESSQIEPHDVIVSPDGGAIAVRTHPSRPIALSDCSAECAMAFADEFIERQPAPVAVVAPVAAARAFAERWSGLRHTRFRCQLAMKLFVARNVISPNPPPEGFGQIATLDHEDLILNWLKAFRLEAVPHDPIPTDQALLESIRARVPKKEFWLWFDANNTPVCLLVCAEPVAGYRWIAPVYTPIESRKRGYGSALTALVSQSALNHGYTPALFTDAANPTSNRIYQSVGYEWVADFEHLAFDPLG